MLKFMSKIGDAAYKTAAKTGIAAGSEMPPYPCAVPLQVVDDPSDVELVESILDAAYAGVQDLMGDLRMLNACDPEGKERPWKALDYTDSDGDIKLMSRKHMGPYNFARATVTFERVLPPQILSSMHTQDLKKRKEYSGNITEYIVIARNPKMPPSLIGKDDDHLVELARDGIRDWHFEYNQYYAPPPVATRDFVYLVEKRYVAAEDAWYIYGTSVDLQTPAVRQMEKEKKSAKCVRGAVMFGWRLARVGADTKATYISCMNPNGWTPTFLVAWVQTEIAKEFQCARRLMYKTYHTTVESPPAKPTRKHKTTAAAKQAATLEEPAPTQPPAARHCDPTAQQVGARSGPVEHQHRLPRPTTTTATTTTTSARDVRPPGIQSVSVSPGVSTTSMPPRLASANMTTVLTPAELHYLQRSFSALYREDSYLSNELEMRSIFEDDLPTGVRALSASMGRFGVTPAQMEEDARLYDDEDPLMF